MSEQAAEAPARNPAGKGDGKNIFTRKIGPMPMWAWLAIISVGIIAWAWYQNKKNPSTAPTDTANASQVPQFVNQTYTTVGAPVAPKPNPPPLDKDKDKDGGKGKGGGDTDEARDTQPGWTDEGVRQPGRRHRRHPTHHHSRATAATSTQPAAPVPGMA